MSDSDSGPTTRKSSSAWPCRIGIVTAVLVIAYLIFARGVDRDLNHDEHQFLAPAALLARGEALPYRDYPLMHLPNLVFAYAAMDRLTGDPILGPKLLCIGASVLVAVCLLVLGIRGTERHRLLVGTGLAALLLLDPLHLHTSGKTWNHEVPACLVVFAILFHVESFRRNSAACLAASAFTAGLAAGCRLTVAPILVPLVLATFLHPIPIRRRWTFAAFYTAVATAALAPSLLPLAKFPEQFIFGNLEFPRLALLDPDNERIQKTMTWWRKARFLFKDVLLPSWPIVLAFAAGGAAPGIAWLRQRSGGSFGSALILLVLPFAFFGIFAPSRYQYQHCYLLIPLLLLGVALGMRSLAPDWRRKVPATLLVLVIGSAATLLLDIHKQLKISMLDWVLQGAQPAKWFPARAAAVGAEIRDHYPSGRVLTLAPVWPLAGGLDVFPEFATAPFAWRNAHFVPPERRHRLKLIAPVDLESFLAAQAPPAILTGVEDKDLEVPLVTYARSHGYRVVKLKRKRELWLPPQ